MGNLVLPNRDTIRYISKTSNPTPLDWNHTVPTIWMNSTSDTAYLLVDNTYNNATWVALGMTGILDWQDSVIDKDLTAPPGAPTTGDRYIVASVATGAWAAHEKDIAQYDGYSWDFTTPNEGFALWVEDENIIYCYNGSAWAKLGTFVDHGNLIGLGDDDHIQYALLIGRTSGQTLIGGVDASANLTFKSTSNATRGTIHFGADDLGENLEIHDAGTLKFWDDSDDTSVTLGPVGDGTTILGMTGTLNASGLQVGGASVYYTGGADVSVADGGTGVSTLALNGVLYGNGTSAIGVTAIGAEGQILRVGASPFVPSWTTATYPATTTINQILYSSSANIIGGITAVNSGVLITSSGGIPSIAIDIPTAVTIGTKYIYRAEGTDIPVADGGTGVSTLLDGGILVGATTGPVEVLPVGLVTELLVGGGAATNPVWTTATGTGAPVRATTPTLVTPILGIPTSGTLTSCTGLPVSTGISGLGSNVATFLATPSSANLASALTNETGSGAVVFGTSPTIATPTITGDITGNGSYFTGLQNIPDLASRGAGYWFDGVDDDISLGTMAGSNLDQGTGDFSYITTVKSLSVDENIILGAWEDADNRFYFKILNDGQVLILGEDSNVLRYYYSTTNLTAAPVGNWVTIGVVGDRDDAAYIYVNGKSESLTVGTAMTAGDVNVNAIAYLGRYNTGGVYSNIAMSRFLAFNLALTAAEVKALSSGAEVPYKYVGASQTAIADYDGTSGHADWSATRVTVASNVAVGGSNALTFTSSVDNSTHYASLNYLDFTHPIEGKKVRIAFSYYIPSGQSNVDGFILVDGAANIVGGDFPSATLDSWTAVSLETLMPTAGAGLLIKLKDGAAESFADAGADDILAIKDLIITQIGCVLDLNPNGITDKVWYDNSGNNLNGTVSGALAVNLPRTLAIRGPIGTGTTTPGILKLSTAETTIVAADELGRIDFTAPLEASGTDAILPGASIWAVAEAEFAASVNSTSLVFATGASEAATGKMYITSAGNVGIGTTSPVSKLDQGKFSADAVGSYHSFTKSRHATPGSHTIVVDNDIIGGLNFAPSDGTDFGTISAQIYAEVDDAAPTASSIGGALVFKTAIGAGADDLTEAMRIDKNQSVTLGGGSATAQLILPLSNDAATPTLAFGDGDSGFYESADDSLAVSIGGSLRWVFTSSYFGSASTGRRPYMLQSVDSTATIPTYGFENDTNTGLGSGAADQLSLIAGGVEGLRIVEDTTINIGIAGATFGTSADKVLAFPNGVAPSTSPADVAQVWSADVNAVAGDAGLHLRVEGGGVYKWGDSAFLPGADNDMSLGSATYRWANVYTADINLSNVGSGGNDVDGTEGSWRLQEGLNTMFLINNKTNVRYKILMEEI